MFAHDLERALLATGLVQLFRLGFAQDTLTERFNRPVLFGANRESSEVSLATSASASASANRRPAPSIPRPRARAPSTGPVAGKNDMGGKAVDPTGEESGSATPKSTEQTDAADTRDATMSKA